MKVFVSSLISGLEPLRSAARAAVETLGHEPIMAEDFGALPHSPQVACLDGVRRAAVVVLMLTDRYGVKQSSGLSATHEEYREARERCPVLVFIQEPMNPEADQKRLIDEVQGWTSGLIRVGFKDATDLQTKITRALHSLEVANASVPFDGSAVLARTLDSFSRDRNRNHYGGAILTVAVMGGPDQAILRPSEIENPALGESLEKEALYGSARIFQRGEAVDAQIADERLVLIQGERNRRSLRLDAQGGILIEQPIENEDRHGSVILVETVEERIALSLRYANWLLDKIDPTQRLSHLVIATRIVGGFTMRTRKEQEGSPSSYTMTGFGQDDRPPVHLIPAHIFRPALLQQREQITVDLTTLLRRQWR